MINPPAPPQLAPSDWRRRATALRRAGEHAAAETADARAIELSAARAPLRDAIRAFVNGRTRDAEQRVRQHLARDPDDAAALCLLADIAAAAGIYSESERLLRRAAALAPGYRDIQRRLADVLASAGRPEDALIILDKLLATLPNDPPVALARIRLLTQRGQFKLAAAAFEPLLAQQSNDPSLLTAHGHVLRTLGRRDAAAASYRRALALEATMAEAWWGLAGLKGQDLNDADIAELTTLLDRPNVPAEERILLGFALAGALDTAGLYSAAWPRYVAANALRRAQTPYDRRVTTALVEQSLQVFAAPHRSNATPPIATEGARPIFIVGLPRSGSTLVEQILASHSHVEATAELAELPMLVHQLVADRWHDRGAAYPDVVRELSPEQLRDVGRRYLAAAAKHRRTDRPLFIDKLPNNWLYVPLIRQILPDALVVDVRRGAMAACVANFRHHFARGQDFAYSLDDLASYYRDYVRLMQHVDQLASGWVTLVRYEDLVRAPEAETRRLLSALSLPFEEACLRPHENQRPVPTASAEQVRRPISAAAAEHWRHYTPWLDELRAALGPEAEA